MRRAGWALGAVLVLLLAPGCGRSAGEEFREDELRPLEQRLDVQRARIAATLRVVRSRNARDARALREDVDALAGTVREVEGLEPPSEASAEFGAYVRALRELVAALRVFPAALRRGERASVDAVSRRVQDATGQVQQRSEQLERRLLDV
ncbi:MAG TPA: hypothetical protein VHF89_00150 [Solirubrobacteraceae bacterium]|nr:hypothetical protein [Solirubrobacteraceae bacterium]